MSHTHLVEAGEAISRIAKANRFAKCLTIWNDSGNAGLRTIRHDPHILDVGDPVFIPDLPENVSHGDDTQQHVFARPATQVEDGELVVFQVNPGEVDYILKITAIIADPDPPK